MQQLQYDQSPDASQRYSTQEYPRQYPQQSLSYGYDPRRQNDRLSTPTNVDTTERQLSVAIGGLLVVHALLNFRRSRSSLLTGPLGLALILHGQSHRSPIYDALGMNTAQRRPTWRRDGRQIGWQREGWRQSENIPVMDGGQERRSRPMPSNTIEIRRAVTIDKPAEELYNYWRKLENLPNFMHHLKQVEQTGEKRSHWTAKLAGGLSVEWDAEIVEDVPNERIAWRTTPDSQVDQAGIVEFKPATGERGTAVLVDIMYSPPGGIVGETFARLLNGVTAQQVKDDIRRFKSLMEAGEIPTIEGQPSGRS